MTEFETGSSSSNGAGSPAAEPALARGSLRGDLRTLLVIAGPNVASTVAQTLLSVVDFLIVSQLPDPSHAQAGVGAGGMLFFTLFGFPLGVMVCVTTVVSQSLGANRPRDCSAYAWQGLWLSVLFGLAGAAAIPAMPHLYGFIGHEPAVRAIETQYTQIRLLSLGFASATVALANYFNGIHRPSVNAVSVVAATIVNIVLSYGLVLGRFGLPAMGVAGAAWGTVVATGFRTCWLMTAMCYGRYAAQYDARRTWRIEPGKMRRLFDVGWPSGLQFVLDIAAWSVMVVWLVGRHGTAHLAASNTVGRYCELSFMPAVGIGLAVCTLVGRSIGEGRLDMARRWAMLGAVVNMTFMTLMGVIYVIVGSDLIRIFNDDPTVVSIGARLLVVAAVFQLFDAAAVTYHNALRGAGDTRWPAIVGAIEIWVILIGGGTLIGWIWPGLESRGPWIAAAAFIVAIGVSFYLRWKSGKWEDLDVIGRSPIPPVAAEPMPVEEAVADAGINIDVEPGSVSFGSPPSRLHPESVKE